MMNAVPRARARATNDQGFTVVEVMIALLILAIVGGALVASMGSSSRSMLRAQMLTAQSSVAEAIQDEIRSNQNWMQLAPCRAAAATPAGCTLPATIFDPSGDRTRGANGAAFAVTAVVRGVDNPLDGLDLADEDGDDLDYFRLDVTVAQQLAPGEPVVAPPMSVSTSVLPEERTASGKLNVAVCQSNVRTTAQVSLGTSCGMGTTTIRYPSGSLVLSGVGGQVLRLTPFDDVTGGTPTSITTDAAGKAILPALAPGHWQIGYTVPSGREIWTSQTSPANLIVRIAANRSSPISIVLRPPPAPPPPPPPTVTPPLTPTAPAPVGSTPVPVVPLPPPPPTVYNSGDGGA